MIATKYPKDKNLPFSNKWKRFHVKRIEFNVGDEKPEERCGHIGFEFRDEFFVLGGSQKRATKYVDMDVYAFSLSMAHRI